GVEGHKKVLIRKCHVGVVEPDLVPGGVQVLRSKVPPIPVAELRFLADCKTEDVVAIRRCAVLQKPDPDVMGGIMQHDLVATEPADGCRELRKWIDMGPVRPTIGSGRR